MSKKDFIIHKLSLMKKDAQDGFKDFVEPLQKMVENKEFTKTVQIPADGNWFTLDFKAVQIKENRLVISAKHKKNGLFPTTHDSFEKEYIVEFSGTRAAYIRGFYKPQHHIYGRPYIY